MFWSNKSNRKYKIRTYQSIISLILVLSIIVAGGCAGERKGSVTSGGELEQKIVDDLKSMTSSDVTGVRIGNVVELPEGKVREVFVNFKGQKMNAYLHLGAESNDIVYASLDDINEQSPVNRAKLEAVKKAAFKFVAGNKVHFKGFDLVDSDKGIDFPKRGYVTYVWKDKRNTDFLKVTVNSKSNKVVSFGRGNKEWTAFCLPPGYLDI